MSTRFFEIAESHRFFVGTVEQHRQHLAQLLNWAERQEAKALVSRMLATDAPIQAYRQ